jgi:quercetin dioxygenase-like cupin family protein
MLTIVFGQEPLCESPGLRANRCALYVFPGVVQYAAIQSTGTRTGDDMSGYAYAWLAIGLATTLAGTPLGAQTDGTCIPVAERAGREYGCFITAREELGPLPATPASYWHLYTYPTRTDAEAARETHSTVVESFGKIWLFTIAPADWQPRTGMRVERVGPLPLVDADSFAAVYMEGTFQPGMHSMVHRHDGAEAWITLEGSMCLETPQGTIEQRAGDPGVLVPGGLPMMLTGTGRGPRRSIVLILQDATRPRSTPATDWTPRQLCHP